MYVGLAPRKSRCQDRIRYARNLMGDMPEESEEGAGETR